MVEKIKTEGKERKNKIGNKMYLFCFLFGSGDHTDEAHTNTRAYMGGGRN